MYTYTARIYKCNISDWIALVAGNILEICSFYMALLLKENVPFHYIQDSPQTVLVFAKKYTRI